MEKRNLLELFLGGALVGGAIYFLFYTERGQKFRDRLADMAEETLDEWLASVEQELMKVEQEAVSHGLKKDE